MHPDDSHIGSLEAIGQSLARHSMSAEFSAHRGVVESLFPYIVQASARMSVRAIGRFLQQQHNVKVSYVTIGRALRNPKKYWNLYFDGIEPAARIYAKAQGIALTDFLFNETFPKAAQNRLVRAAVKAFVEAEVQQAVNVLRNKWFCIDIAIRLNARPHLERRLANGKA